MTKTIFKDATKLRGWHHPYVDLLPANIRRFSFLMVGNLSTYSAGA